MKNGEFRSFPISMLILLIISAAGLCANIVGGQGNQEKPIIVCTTSVLGSIVEGLVGDAVEITILVNPSLCPADYDIKPGDIYAISKAKMLFYHDIPGEKPWLNNLIEAANNEQLIRVKVPGTYNTPDGAKSCIKIIGGNLSQVLGVDLSDKVEAMLNEIDSVAVWIRNESQSLKASSFSVICMKWQKTFVEWVGFKVVASYDPPERLSLADVSNLIKIAKENNVTLIVDNLQVSAEFGASIASEVGAVHVVLTNFPGAIPGTGNLARMFRYNAEVLLNGLRRWKLTREMETELSSLRSQVEGLKSEVKSLTMENESLKNQVAYYQAAIITAAVIAALELIVLLASRRRISQV